MDDIIEFLNDIVFRVGGDEIWGYSKDKKFLDFLDIVRKKQSVNFDDDEDTSSISYSYYQERPGTNKWVHEIDVKIDTDLFHGEYLDEINTLPKGFEEWFYSKEYVKFHSKNGFRMRTFKRYDLV